jgi:cytosine/adenosine deaminase-related metal-dependent hydrolase
VLRENTILIHAMALSDGDIAILARRKCKVVWCPASNLRLYGKTAPVEELRSAGIDVVLGTDSTISGSPTLLHELRAAAGTGLAAADDLLAMVTHRAAAAFGLEDGRGALEPRGRADVIVIPKRGPAADSLLAAGARDLALVLVGGRPRLARSDIGVVLELGEPNASIDDQPFHVDRTFTTLRTRLGRALGDDYPHSDLWALCR